MSGGRGDGLERNGLRTGTGISGVRIGSIDCRHKQQGWEEGVERQNGRDVAVNALSKTRRHIKWVFPENLARKQAQG